MSSANKLLVVEPLRAHTWRESAADAVAVEERHDDSVAQDPDALDANSAPSWLRYATPTDSPFEMIALGFDAEGLVKIMYPVHFPAREGAPAKSLDAIPGEFQAIRDWLWQHLGEPTTFTATPECSADFTAVELLVEQSDYRIVYSWCTDSANAFLSAQRLEGSEPVILAEVVSPDVPTDARYTAIGHGCPEETRS